MIHEYIILKHHGLSEEFCRNMMGRRWGYKDEWNISGISTMTFYEIAKKTY